MNEADDIYDHFDLDEETCEEAPCQGCGQEMSRIEAANGDYCQECDLRDDNDGLL